VIGFLNTASLDTYSHLLRAFRQALEETGFVEGDNLTIEYRWAENQFERLPALAGELVRQQVAVIAATGGGFSAVAAKQATPTIPIVFAVGEDPVRLGLVASLARPGGNVTGVYFFIYELAAKRLTLLRELLPTANRVAVLVNPANAAHTESTLRDVEEAASAIGLQTQMASAGTVREIDAAFSAIVSNRIDALFVLPDPFFITRRVQLVQLAARHAIPATYPGRDFAEVGGLMSYGTDISDAWRQTGTYVGRILKGAKPPDLPVMQSSKFELIINAQTARMLDLSVSPQLLARADEVIE
jgi:putative ABC transport system substrate-binding protein